MRPVRSIESGVAVVDVDEPPGTGQLLKMQDEGDEHLRLGSELHQATGPRIELVTRTLQPGLEQSWATGKGENA